MSADHKAATEYANWYSYQAKETANLKAAYLEARAALKYCYEKLQPFQPFDDWVKEIGK